MKRSSKIGLLLSVFALLSAVTLGISNSNASQTSEAISKVASPYYTSRIESPVIAPFYLPTWEEKRQLFEQQLALYNDERCGSKFRRLHRLGEAD